MWILAASVWVAALCSTAERVARELHPLQYICRFPEAFANKATHVLVVNPQGSVIEVWKGDARLGEVIPIHTLANLTITQSKREDGVSESGFGLGGWRQTSHLSLSAWSSAGCERLILFLIKSDSPDPTNGLLNGWRPASPSGFDSSCFRVKPFGRVYAQPQPWPYHGTGFTGFPGMSGFRGSEESFNDSVFRAINLPLPVDPKK